MIKQFIGALLIHIKCVFYMMVHIVAIAGTAGTHGKAGTYVRAGTQDVAVGSCDIRTRGCHSHNFCTTICNHGQNKSQRST